ncbi:MAG: tRNA uridine-5-carboxymethylaminomethyl(34) synthesis GTPase MnmE [candidate division WOR-3 bacterium]
MVSSSRQHYKFINSDTIAAIATAPGISSINVIRISGENAIATVEKIFQGKIKLSQAKGNTVHFGKIINPVTKKMLDEVLVTVFKAPNSYTGEDMVEISCHGGNFVASAILDLLLKIGARLAQPGEFTKRRVLAGKMDVTQAEAILDLTQAKTETGFNQAIEQLQGKLSNFVNNLTADIKNIIVQLENLLEFEENEKTCEFRMPPIKKAIKQIATNLQNLIAQNEQLRFFRNGVYCAIIGRPNVGKSSLFNRLIENERAIVTEFPGTTRDSLQQTVVIDGIIFHLVDTAGLRSIKKPSGKEKIEAIGIEHTKHWLNSADFILAIYDYSQTMTKDDELVYKLTHSKPHLTILNKVDLPKRFDVKYFGKEKFYEISAKYNQGINQLKRAMVKYYQQKISSANNYLYLNQRHITALKEVVNLLAQIEHEQYLENAIINLRSSLDTLTTLTNPINNEEILDAIFKNFCIGK